MKIQISFLFDMMKMTKSLKIITEKSKKYLVELNKSFLFRIDEKI